MGLEKTGSGKGWEPKTGTRIGHEAAHAAKEMEIGIGEWHGDGLWLSVSRLAQMAFDLHFVN